MAVESVQLDASSAGGNGGASNVSNSWTHGTITAKKHRLLVVSVSYSAGTAANSTAAISVTSVTYGGIALTFLTRQQNADGSCAVELWYMTNPPDGAGQLVSVMTSASCYRAAAAHVYYGVDFTSPIDSALHVATGNSTAARVTMPSKPLGMWHDVTGTQQPNTGVGTTSNASTTKDVDTGSNSAPNGTTLMVEHTPGNAASTTIGPNLSTSGQWVIVGIVLNNAAYTTFSNVLRPGMFKPGLAR